jgi:hypothetical protein
MALIGETIEDYVAEQIEVRQRTHGSGVIGDREDQDLLELNLKTSFLKLASGVSVSSSKLEEIGFSANDAKTFSGRGLAKEYVLFNGISTFKDNKDGLIQKSDFLGETYEASPDWGIVPMPGLVSADIKSLNRGSLKKAIVKFTVHNRQQLQILDILYLRLGYTVLLEWGNSMYKHYENGITTLKKIGYTLVDNKSKFFSDQWTNSPFKILQEIEEMRKNYQGNYDGLLGKVSNFNWSFNNDGSYDVELTIISLGDVIESLSTSIVADSNTLSVVKLTSNNNDQSPLDKNKTSNIILSMLSILKFQNSVSENIKGNPPLTIETVDNPTSYPGYLCKSDDKFVEASNYQAQIHNGNIGLFSWLIYNSAPASSWLKYDVLYTFRNKQMAEGTKSKIKDFDKNKRNSVWDEYSNKQLYRIKDAFLKDITGKNTTISFTKEASNTSVPQLWFYLSDEYYPAAKIINPEWEDPNIKRTDNQFRDGEYEEKLKEDLLKDSRIVVEDNREIPQFINRAAPTYFDIIPAIIWKSKTNNGYVVFDFKSGADEFNEANKTAYDAKQTANNPIQDAFNTFQSSYPTGSAEMSSTATSPFRSGGSASISDVLHASVGSAGFETLKNQLGFDLINGSYETKVSKIIGSTTTIKNPWKNVKDFDSKDTFTISKLNTPQYYIRFGLLLNLIKQKITPKIGDSNQLINEDEESLIDINYTNAPMICLEQQISFDWRTCIVSRLSFKREKSYNQNIFPEIVPWIDSSVISEKFLEIGNRFTPKDGAEIDLTEQYIKDNPKLFKKLQKGYIYSQSLPVPDGSQLANAMNIYLNFEFVASCITSNTDEKGNVSLFKFVKSLCTGINISLGGVNNLEPVINENLNRLEIIDSTPNQASSVHNTTKIDKKSYKLNLFGYDLGNPLFATSNFARKVDLKTAITPEYATMITIGATAGGYVKGIEGTAFSRWNIGIEDSFKPTLVSADSTVNGNDDKDPIVDVITNFENSFQLSAESFGIGQGGVLWECFPKD